MIVLSMVLAFNLLLLSSLVGSELTSSFDKRWTETVYVSRMCDIHDVVTRPFGMDVQSRTF
jgi:hypothetical protein